ncbi:MAG: putative toxin-antitoxin system toxin component, PIN family [Acidobacteriota bacterium]
MIDTNLFVRGLLRGPVTLPLIQAWKERRFRLVSSEALLEELFDVLARPRFTRYFTRAEVRELGQLIYSRAEIVEPRQRLLLCRDPKDNVFLEVAATAGADYLVTGDDDLRDDTALKDQMLSDYGVRIVSVPDFLAALTAAERQQQV